MKAKIISVLFAIMITAMGIAGCGNATTQTAEQEVEEVAEEPETEPEAPEEPEAPAEPVYETLTYHLLIEAVEEAVTAYDAEGTLYELHAAEDLPEEQASLLASGNTVTITTEVEEGTAPAAPEEGAPIELAVNGVEAMEEQAGYELKQAVSEKLYGYIIEDMADTQMFAKSSVNVRKGPSADDEKIGSLTTAQEVTVTGLTSTNWYRVNYGDGTAFVSANYLVNEKPVVQTASTGSSGGNSSGNSGAASAGAGGSVSDAYLVYSSAEMDAAYASGDMATYEAMLQANIDAYDAKYGTAWGSASAQAPVTSGGGSGEGSSSSEKSTSTSREFADYLNQKRQEEGKPTMEWSESLADLAKQRAEEIVDNFSHETSLPVGSEIIQKNPSGEVSSWFNEFYNSTGHRINMMYDGNSEVGAAVCRCGSYYYIVVLFDI